MTRTIGVSLSLLLVSALAAQSARDTGYAVELSVRGLSGEPPRPGQDATVDLRIRDAAGAPLAGVGLNAWFAEHPAGAPPLDRQQCVQRIARFTAGGLFHQPALDLNVYHIVVMNADGTLSVIDPRFSFGGSRLLALVELPAPGTDWALSRNGRHLFVATPASGQVAVVDTVKWKVTATLDAGPSAGRLLLQPDEGYLWAASADGIVAIDPSKQRVVKRIPTGSGPHDLALSGDGRTLFVTNAGAGTTSVVDVHRLEVARHVPTGARPVSVAWSPLASAAYVASEDGAVLVLDPDRAEPRARIDAVAGLSLIRFGPAKHLGFLVNPGRNSVYVLDVVTNQIVQTAIVEKGPYEVTFSDSLAYVRHLHSETVLMIPLAATGTAGARVTVADFPGGQRGFGDTGVAPIPADGIVTTPARDAMLVTNPADKQIYFYREGMAAPMGSLSAYSRVPLATMVIDRTLREITPGHYSTLATMPKKAGLYDVAVFVGAPRLVACVQVAVSEEPALDAVQRATP